MAWQLAFTVQFSLRWYLCARKSPYTLHTHLSEVSPTLPFETVQMLVWLTMALFRPFKEDRLVLLLSTPLFSRRSMVWWPLALCPQGVFTCVKRLAPLYHLAVTEPHAGRWRSSLSEEASLLYGLLCGLSSDFGVLQIFLEKKSFYPKLYKRICAVLCHLPFSCCVLPTQIN